MDPFVLVVAIIWVLAGFSGAYLLYRRFTFFRSLKGIWAIFGVFFGCVLVGEGLSQLAGLCGSFNEILAYLEYFLAGIAAFLFIIQAFVLAGKVDGANRVRGRKKTEDRRGTTTTIILILSTAVVGSFGVAWGTGYLAHLFANSKAMPKPTFEKKEITYSKDEILVQYKKSKINLKTNKGKTQAANFAYSKSTKIKEDFETINVSLLKIKDKKTVEQKITEFEKDPKVKYAEPNYQVYIEATPNDPNFSKLYGLHNTGQTGGTVDADIDAPEAWDMKTGSTDITVAVIDTGVDYNHSDLKDNIWVNSGEKKNNGKDDDGNGYVDDAGGWDFYNEDNDPIDDHGHGTHCAGTIGAVGDNNTGVVGVNWNIKIMPLKFLSAYGYGYTSDAVRAVEYATLMEADVMSNSWGGGGYSQSLYDAILAAKDAGILFIAAAGNNGSNNDQYPHYPSNYTLPNVISVAATDHNDALTSWSNYGATSVDVGAPGLYIYSTYPNNSYTTMSGTSMATPHVAGLAGLILSADPSLTYSQVKDAILDTGDTKLALVGRTVSGKRINAYGALSSLFPTITANTAGGLWYNANPALAVSFSAVAGLDSVFYQIDSYTGDWAPIFSNLAESSYTINFSIPDATWEGFKNGDAHTIYFMMTDDEGTVVGDDGSEYLEIKKDVAPPSVADDYPYDGTLVHFSKTVTFLPADVLSGVSKVNYCRGSGCDPIADGKAISSSPYQINLTTSQDTIVRYRAVDNAGNRSPIDQFSVELRRVDININKKVDLPDFSIMMSVWGRKSSYSAYAFRSDLNASKVVDLPDFSLLMANWGKVDK